MFLPLILKTSLSSDYKKQSKVLGSPVCLMLPTDDHEYKKKFLWCPGD